MPVRKRGNKYAIGDGPAVYTSREKAQRAMRAYKAKSRKGKTKG